MAKKRQLDAKRIVVKVGTSTLIHPNGKVNFHAWFGELQCDLVASLFKSHTQKFLQVPSAICTIGLERDEFLTV